MMLALSLLWSSAFDFSWNVHSVSDAEGCKKSYRSLIYARIEMKAVETLPNLQAHINSFLLSLCIALYSFVYNQPAGLLTT